MRLDKTVFKKQCFQDAANHQSAYRQMDSVERAESFNYLMSVAYGFAGQNWPRMDKTIFQKRRRDEVSG